MGRAGAGGCVLVPVLGETVEGGGGCGERAQVWQGRAGCPLEIQILGLSPLQNMSLGQGRPEVDVRVLLWSFWGWSTRCTARLVAEIREQSGSGPVSLCFEAWGPDVGPSWESGWRGGQGRAWGSSEQRGWEEEATARETGWGGVGGADATAGTLRALWGNAGLPRPDSRPELWPLGRAACVRPRPG